MTELPSDERPFSELNFAAARERAMFKLEAQKKAAGELPADFDLSKIPLGERMDALMGRAPRKVAPWSEAKPLENFFKEDDHEFSDAAQEVSRIFESISLKEVWDRLVHGEYGDGRHARSTSGEVKVRCPEPGHVDTIASASMDLDSEQLYCYVCEVAGLDKAGVAGHYAYGFPLPIGAHFFDVKKRVVKDLRGYDYDAEMTKVEPAAAAPAVAAAIEPDITSPSRWQRIDLGELGDLIEAGTIERPSPTMARIEHAGALFYRGAVNGVAGDSNSGKTFTALLACLQEVRDGNTVLFIDYEEGAVGTASRLLDMGATKGERERIVYVNPEDNFDATWAEEVITEFNPSLVIIDSTGVSMAMDNSKPNDDDDVARWFKRVPLFIASRGPGVVILDHVTKESNGGGLWPIGSQRKRAAITGAQYMQQVVQSFSRSKDGYSILTCAKDRHGTYEQGQVVARLEVKDAAATVRLVMEVAASRMSGNAMLVLNHIKSNPGCIQRDIEKGTGLNNRTVSTAVKELEGLLEIEVRKVGVSNHHFRYGEADGVLTDD